MIEAPTDEQLPEDLVEELDETSAEFVEQLVTKLVLFTEQFCDIEFFPYQIPIAYRVIESIVLGDGEEITLVATRQSGKSEVISNVLASMMVILPKLSAVYHFSSFLILTIPQQELLGKKRPLMTERLYTANYQKKHPKT